MVAYQAGISSLAGIFFPRIEVLTYIANTSKELECQQPSPPDIPFG